MSFTPNTPFFIRNTELHTWSERDRQHVELRNLRTQQTILEFWDDDVIQAYKDGFLNHKSDLHTQMYDLAVKRGLIRSCVQQMRERKEGWG